MTLNRYQETALKAAAYPEEYRTIYPAFGTTDEAGECSDKVKKVIHDNDCGFTDDRRYEIAKETGGMF